MTKQPIKLFDLWQETMDVMTRTGILLNSVSTDGKPNTMTIGWMTGGEIWGKPMLLVFVRMSRFTYSRIERVPEFTVNVLPPEFSEAIQHCGTHSGRESDKFAHTNLTPAPAQKVQVPIVAEGLIHYECRVVHKNDVIFDNLATEIVTSAYPHGDYHRVYFGEVVASYASPDARARLRSAA